MANLIPPEAKKDIALEYWVRVFVVWVILFCAALVVVCLLILPTFVLVNSQLSVFLNQSNEAMIKQQTFQEAQLAIEEANELSALLISGAEGTRFTRIQSEIDRLAGNGVTISELKVSIPGSEPSTLSVTGIANTRTTLAEFSNAVGDHELFGKAVVPISNLVKDKDIPFTISVELIKNTP